MALTMLLAAVLLLDPAPPPVEALNAADKAKAFAAAGFKRRGRDWRKCDDPGTAGYLPGRIESVADYNRDGLPEAVIVEDSSACFGAAGTGFVLVGKQRDGSWKNLLEDTGVLVFLKSRGAGNWPDVEIGGPGFCFPRFRWDGKAWREVGSSYEGKPCRR